MKYALLLIGFVAAPAAAQTTTNCTQMGNTVRCTTDDSASRGQAQVDRQLQTLAETAGKPPVIYRATPSVPRQSAPADEAYSSAYERRRIAYSQVGALIAKGDCDGAMRLARFYGQADLINDTAKACTPTPSAP